MASGETGINIYSRVRVVYCSLIASLFFLHIIFAANNFNLLFRVVSLTITILILFAGVILVFFNRSSANNKELFFEGFFISIALSLALGWAYGGRSYSIEMVIFPTISIIIHLIIWQSKVIHTYGLK